MKKSNIHKETQTYSEREIDNKRDAQKINARET